jgi:hypothetical protein
MVIYHENSRDKAMPCLCKLTSTYKDKAMPCLYKMQNINNYFNSPPAGLRQSKDEVRSSNHH